jgi:hypothetical protein
LNADSRWLFFAIACPLSLIVLTTGLLSGKSRKRRARRVAVVDPYDSTALASLGMSY